jgi:hypothetical protein
VLAGATFAWLACVAASAPADDIKEGAAKVYAISITGVG